MLKLVCNTCGVTVQGIRNQVQYFLPLVLFFLCALLLTVGGLLCIQLLCYVYFCYLTCIFLLCVYCCLTYFSCWIAGQKSISGRSCDRPPRQRLFLVSLCLKVNAEMVPNTPICYCMLLMQPFRIKFRRSLFHIYVLVHGLQLICSENEVWNQ